MVPLYNQTIVSLKDGLNRQCTIFTFECRILDHVDLQGATYALMLMDLAVLPSHPKTSHTSSN